MRGIHWLKIVTKDCKYNLTLRRNITVVRGCYRRQMSYQLWSQIFPLTISLPLLESSVKIQSTATTTLPSKVTVMLWFLAETLNWIPINYPKPTIQSS